MKNLAFITLFLICCTQLQSQSETSSSPYFMVFSDDPTTDVLPLKSTKANVKISGVIADVMVEQTYMNMGKKALEAIYVFPGSTSAAIYGMQMQIGNRIIEATIEEKGKARQIYAAAKSEGKRTSLLEQQRPNVFQMNVANILPGDSIKVRMKYTELLVPDEGVYQFVYPTVVGPRYINGNEQTNTSYAAMPYLHEGVNSPSAFNMTIQLSTGVPIQNIHCTTHLLAIKKLNPSTAKIMMISMDNDANHDFVLQYSLKGKQIETGLLLYEEGNEKYFLCMVQPPKQVDINSVPPREFIFVVDVSGSMNGFPLEVSKKLLNDLITGLRPHDRFNVLLFAGGSQVLAEKSIPANALNIKRALDLINQQQGGGGTELLPALRESLNMPRDVEGLARSIVVITDGYVGIEPEAFELVRQNLNNANLYAFGIGSDVNRFLIEGLAHTGQGLPAIVLNEQEAPKAAEKFRQYISNPLFTQVTTQFKGFDAYDIEPLTIPDVLSDRPMIIFGKWRGKAEGTIAISGFTGDPSGYVPTYLGSLINWNTNTKKGKSTTITVDVSKANPDIEFSALKYLWARERLKRLSDYDGLWHRGNEVKEITDLGLEFHLLTEYTSFVAVDDTPAPFRDETLTTINQPLPMPEGVSDYAVGFSLDITGVTGMITRTSIELYFIIGIVVILLIGIFFLRRKSRIKSSMFILCALFCSIGCTNQPTDSTCRENCIEQAKKITFILGQDVDSENAYYQQASLFFKQQAQDGTQVVVEHIRSLEAVYQYLENEIPVNGPWEQINLVVHGNRWTGIALPVNESQNIRTSGISLKNAIDNGDFHPLSSSIINICTNVEIYGCSVGLDTALMHQFSKLFTNQLGEQSIVHASSYFNIFYTLKEVTGKSKNMQAECFFVTYPLEKKPSEDELTTALEKKYPEKCIDWKNALLRQNPDETKLPYAYQFHIPVKWTFLYQHDEERPAFKWQDQLRSWVNHQPDISSTLHQMELTPEQFWWTAKPVDYKVSSFQTQPALDIKGSTKVYCVLVPIQA